MRRTLARPATHAGVAASVSASNSTPASSPLLQFPAFHPVPFQQDKFLSIKTRSLETYTKLRGDVLQRSAELSNQLQRHYERKGMRNGDAGMGAGTSSSSRRQEQSAALDCEAASASSSLSASSLELPSLPLAPHQAEELLLLSKKVESLSDFQGLVLSDELVWRMFHLCVQCGAPQQAVGTWLQKHIIAEHRGPPYPLLIIEDLATLLRASVLPRLPESGAGLSCCSIFVSRTGKDAASLAALEDGLMAAQRYLQLHSLRDFAEDSALEDTASCATQQYTNHLIHDFVRPVWRSLAEMQLTFDALKQSAVNENAGEGGEPEGEDGDTAGDTANDFQLHHRRSAQDFRWPPDAAEQTKAAHTTLMSVSPLYSFHLKPPGAATPATLRSPTAWGGKAKEQPSAKTSAASRAQLLLSHSPPHFSSEVDAVVAPLRALLDLWLVVAQCASEAKDVALLHDVQRTICTAFFTRVDAVTEQPSPIDTINEAAWCHYPSPPPPLSCTFSSAAEMEACRTAAEVQAKKMVRGFVGAALSVVQYGLLCAEQEAAVWQLHDTCALIFGGSSILHELRGTKSSSSPLGGRVSAEASERRLCALTIVTQHQAAEAQAGNLVRNVLPRFLCATARQAVVGASGALMMESVRAFLSHTLASSTAGGAEGEDCTDATFTYFADAGLYVGLTTCDDGLLQYAAEAASMSEAEATLTRLTAHALQAYRDALSSLAHLNAEDAEATTESLVSNEIEDASERLEQLMGLSGSADASTASQVLDGCLQILLLDMARRQAESAAAFVQAVHHSRQRASPQARAEEEEEGGEGQNAEDSAAQDAHQQAEAEEMQQAAAEQAWAELREKSTQSIAVAFEHIAVLLARGTASREKDAVCLSPSALSSLAVLTRVGSYLEREGRTTADTTSSLSSSVAAFLDSVVPRLTADACALLQRSLSPPVPSASAGAAALAGPTTAVAGTWVQWVLVALMNRHDWAGVLRVLKALDGHSTEVSGAAALTPSSLLSGATLDPSVFAAIYARAQEDGAAGVCAFLRSRREALFF